MFVINSIYNTWIPASHAIELGSRVLKTATTKILRLARAIKSIKYHYTILLIFLSNFTVFRFLLKTAPFSSSALPRENQPQIGTVNSSYRSSILIPMEQTAGDLLSRKSQTTAPCLNSSVPEYTGTGSQWQLGVEFLIIFIEIGI